MLNIKIINDGLTVSYIINCEKNKGPSIAILNKWIYNIQNNIELKNEQYINNTEFKFIISSESLKIKNVKLSIYKFQDSIISFLNDLKQFSCDLGKDNGSIIKSQLYLLEKNQFPVIHNNILYETADYSRNMPCRTKEEFIEILKFCD